MFSGTENKKQPKETAEKLELRKKLEAIGDKVYRGPSAFTCKELHKKQFVHLRFLATKFMVEQEELLIQESSKNKKKP